MPNNNLILRRLISPWRTEHMDVTRHTTLTHADLDNNFIYLRGQVIESATLDGDTLKLSRICGDDVVVNLSGLTQSNDESMRLISDASDDIRDDLDSNVTIINNTINELKDDMENNTIWEWGSRGEKSIKVKNGSNNDATGDYSVSEGYNTKATGDFSNAEGINTTASGDESHAEGSNTTASGRASHVGGASSYANGDASFAHSKESKSDGESSVVLGGNLNVVEGSGENSGVFVGKTNKILGLDYQKSINDLETELKVLTDERNKAHEEYVAMNNDLKEELDLLKSQLELLLEKNVENKS